MFRLPNISMIRFPKLMIHTLLLTIILTFLALLSTDIEVLILGHPVEKNTNNVNIIVFIWFFFALQSEKYRKQENSLKSPSRE